VSGEVRPVLVTGGSGFLGAAVLPRLVARGAPVHALARSARAGAVVTARGARPWAGDLDDPASIDAVFAASGAEVLVNLASLGFGQAPTIVAAAERHGLARVVAVSSTAIFTSVEAPSKARRRAGEQVVTSSALDWTVIRPTMIYGTPEDRNMARLLRFLRRSPVMPVPGSGLHLQQPVHVDDVADAIVAALDRPVSIGRCYDVAGRDPLTFRQIIHEAGAALGRRPRVVGVPMGPAALAVGTYERWSRRPRLRVEQLERLEEDKAFDWSAAATDLGYGPRSFAQGIRAEVAMLRDR
jgi:uncharacterized protein YbjT (DUF2867 family)